MSLGFRRPAPISLFAGDVPTLLLSDPVRGGDGALRLNPEKSLAKWRWVPATWQNQTPFTIPSGGTLTATLEVNPQGGDDAGQFEIASILSKLTSEVASPRVAIQPQVISPTLTRYLSNVPISSELLSGPSQIPGLLPSTILSLPDTSWQFLCQNLTAASVKTQVALWGRQFVGCGNDYLMRLMRRAKVMQSIHPYWIGPKDPNSETLTGPEVVVPAGQQVLVTLPIPDDSDFLWIRPLDASSRVGGGTLDKLFAQMSLNDSGRGLADLTGIIPSASSANSPLGVNWQNFLAAASMSVLGFSGNKINSFSVGSNAVRDWTHLVPRNTQITILFTNKDSVAITLRIALFGLLVYGRQPADRQTSITGQAQRDRVTQGEEFLRRMGLHSAFAGGQR